MSVTSNHCGKFKIKYAMADKINERRRNIPTTFADHMNFFLGFSEFFALLSISRAYTIPKAEKTKIATSISTSVSGLAY